MKFLTEEEKSENLNMFIDRLINLLPLTCTLEKTTTEMESLLLSMKNDETSVDLKIERVKVIN